MRRRPPRWLALALAGSFLFAGGVSIGARLDDPTGAVASTPVDTLKPGPGERGDAVVDDVVAKLSTHTPAGAVETATAYAVAFDGPTLLDPVLRGELLDEYSARDAKAELERVLGEAATLINDRLALDAAVFGDEGFVWRSVPAGWQLETFHPERAVVAIWATGVVIARGLPLTQPSWRTTKVDLVWERDGWRVQGFESEPGPEPPIVGGTAGAASQARLINAFQPFHHVVSSTGEPTP